MPTTPRPNRFLDFWSAFVVLAVGAAFWLPGFQRTNGRFPIPLDDVYIHFAFARSAALGHPFQWTIGNGYSSGGTSLTYPLALAPGWLLGFREDKLAWFAAIITCLCLIDVCRSVRALLPRSSAFVPWFVPLVLLAVPLADWSFYSGMETALFAAVLGRFVKATQVSLVIGASSRARAQFRAGLWGALLVATRPEAAALVLPFAIAVAYGARALGSLGSLLRTLGPMFVFLAGQASANYLLTSEVGQAGAVRKLIGTNPYLTPAEIAIEVLKNLIVLQTQAFDAALGGRPWSLILPALVLIGIAHRRTRLFALPSALGAAGMLLLVSLNSTARFQNFRYAVPSILILLLVAISSLGLLASKGKWGRVIGFLAGLVLIAAPARQFSKQIDHFARASANIEGQQATVGRRLAEQTPSARRVFVGDAGAIPYLSGIAGLDGLGLGGYHDFPFARASVHGVPAVVELIERLPKDDRPDLLAIYPSWWPELATSFGKELFTVHIDDNVICAAPDKVVYSADWATLQEPGEIRPNQIDEIDMADLVSERAHRYAFPHPRGGWVIGTTLTDAHGRRRYDAGRIIPEGQTESFRLSLAVPSGPAQLVLRSDADAPTRLRIAVFRAGQMVFQEEHSLAARVGDAWNEPVIALPNVTGGDEIVLTSVANAWRHHHAWLIR